MARSPRAAALAVALLLLCAAGARATAAAAGKGGAASVTAKEATEIVAIFAQNHGLLRVVRRAIAEVKKEAKKARGKRNLLEDADSGVVMGASVAVGGKLVVQSSAKLVANHYIEGEHIPYRGTTCK
jgi:hypothetical protein